MLGTNLGKTPTKRCIFLRRRCLVWNLGDKLHALGQHDLSRGEVYIRSGTG
jgi:hypothetical protein